MLNVQPRAPARASSPAAVYTVDYDMVRNLIRISGNGFLEAQHFDGMFGQTGQLIENCHALGRPVRLLVDNRCIMLHAPEAAERLRQGAALHTPGTRVAIIVESSLARMQFRRVLDMNIHAFFSNEQEAIAWLFDGDPE